MLQNLTAAAQQLLVEHGHLQQALFAMPCAFFMTKSLNAAAPLLATGQLTVSA
jgi:hypothetical protein